MGIIASYIGFDGDVPSLEAIAAAVEQRTGLRCKLTLDQHGFVVVKCREIYTDIDLRIDGKVVSIEQPISLSVYFFEQLREALVDLGGQRHGLGSSPSADARVPTAPVRWRERKWTLRMLDRHPVITSLIWIVLMVPAALYRRLRRKPG